MLQIKFIQERGADQKEETSDISDVPNSPKNSGLPADLRSSVSLVVLNTNRTTSYYKPPTDSFSIIFNLLPFVKVDRVGGLAGSIIPTPTRSVPLAHKHQA